VYAYIRNKDSKVAKAGTPYYIGKGKNNRIREYHRKHISIPKDDFYIVFLETNLTDLGALALERRYIKWYGRIDNETGILRNRTDGGEGSSGVIMSEESRKKKSLALSGKPKSEEHKRKLSKPKSEKHKKNLSISHTGKSLSTEHKNQISDTLKGAEFTEEHKRNLSIAGKNVIKSKEHRKNISLSRIGKIMAFDLETNTRVLIPKQQFYDNTKRYCGNTSGRIPIQFRNF